MSNYTETVSEEELRVHAKQLEEAVVNLLYILRCTEEAASGSISRAEIQEARHLVGLSE